MPTVALKIARLAPSPFRRGASFGGIIGALCISIALTTLGGCAMRSPGTAAAPTGDLPNITARTLVGEWQRQLDAHVAGAGSGDPAVLSKLPALRSPAVMRPGQIVFAATDLDAFVPERDGYDVFGLLLGRYDSAAGPWYVFIVGTIERSDYRALAVADVRLAAMSVQKETTVWATGTSDPAVLARYRQVADATTAVRFPADGDRFRLVSCEPGVCAEEAASGARWVLYLPPVK